MLYIRPNPADMKAGSMLNTSANQMIIARLKQKKN